MASDILIVDDEADIRDLVSGILEDEGHNTRLARDSDEALRSIEERRPHLVIPYSLDCNDMRFASSHGFAQGEDFFVYLRDTFDALYREGEMEGLPKMMSVGLHCRLAGRPGRSGALERFLDHVQNHDRVWICRRIDIARHWIAHHPANGDGRP